MNDYKTWEDIEIICDLLNITATDFADQIGVTSDTVTRWKNGKNEISAENLNKV